MYEYTRSTAAARNEINPNDATGVWLIFARIRLIMKMIVFMRQKVINYFQHGLRSVEIGVFMSVALDNT